MSEASVKSILDKEFRNFEKGGKSKIGKKKKIKDCLGPERHGLKKQKLKLKRQRSAENAPKKRLFLAAAADHQYIGDDVSEKSDDITIEESVKNLMRLSQFSGSKLTGSSKVVEHNMKSKRNYEPKCRQMNEFYSSGKKKRNNARDKSSSTLFTDEDFEKFSKEYFGKSEPINSKTIQNKRKKAEEAEYNY